MINSNKDPGFTKVPNFLLEGLISNKLNGTQYRILLHIMRFTHGFHRDNHEMSLSFFSDAINADKSYVKNELNTLIGMNVVEVVKEASYTNSRRLKVNGNLESWRLEKRNQYRGKSTVVENVHSTVDNNINTTVDNPIHSTVDTEIHQEKKEKEINNFKESEEDFLY